jgi:Galactose oxidase, central domain/Kelch motif
MKRILFALVPLATLLWVAALMPSRSVLSSASRGGTVLPASPMLEPRSGHSATVLPDGRVLIAGGMRRNRDIYRSAELYDPGSGAFKGTGEMHVGRVGQAAVLLRSGKVLIAGGWVGYGATDSAELYDPFLGTFKVIANLTTNRGRPTATLLADGDVLIAGGGQHEAPGGIVSAEVFRAATHSFQLVGSMHFGRVGHTATLLTDGRVLIAGGRDDQGVTATAEIYDPSTRRFTLTGSMHTARYRHTAGLLPDGQVLIAGGSDERDWRGNLASAEIYDPRTGEFAVAPSLNDPRFKLPAKAVRLSSGQLLIAGGSRSTEIYDFREGKFLLASGQMSDSWHFMSETLLKDGRVLLAGGYPDND